MDSIAVIVPNWNGLDVIADCLRSLAAQDVPVTVIVVDNGSTDGSRELVERDFPDIVLLPQPVNLGFAGGVNVGIRYALDKGFRYVGLFNSDAIADPAWAGRLAHILDDDDKAGIATGLLLHGDGATIDSTGDWYSIWGLPFPRGRGQATDSAPAAGAVFSGSGGASLYRTAVFRDVGLFDETFFAYYEDVDMSFRAQLAGFTVTYEPAAVAYHERGAASSKIGAVAATAATKVSGFTVYQTFKNLPLLFVKDVPASLLARVGIRFYTAYGFIFANAVRRGHGGAAVKGVLRSLSLLPHALRERTRIQGEKRVGADYIASILWNDLPPDQSGLRKLRKSITRTDKTAV